MNKLFQKFLKKGPAVKNGFSLIECVIAMIITMIGVLATVALMALGVRMQVVARDSTAANAYARSKIEQLQNYQPTAAQRLAGGSITTDVTGYNDLLDNRYRRRWLIEAPGVNGVPANTQRITIVVVADRSDVLMPTVQVMTLVPAS